MKTRLGMILNEYEALFNNGELTWRPYSTDAIPYTLVPQNCMSAAMMLDTFFGSNIKIEVAEQELDDTQLFKIDDPSISYIVIDPITLKHIWVNSKFSDSVPPDYAMAHFYSRNTGVSVELAIAALKALDKMIRP